MSSFLKETERKKGERLKTFSFCQEMKQRRRRKKMWMPHFKHILLSTRNRGKICILTIFLIFSLTRSLDNDWKIVFAFDTAELSERVRIFTYSQMLDIWITCDKFWIFVSFQLKGWKWKFKSRLNKKLRKFPWMLTCDKTSKLNWKYLCVKN